MFGNLGATEIIFILVIVLLVFGAKRLPEIGQSLGKGIREFKKSMSDITGEINQATQPPQYPPQQYAPPQYAAPQPPQYAATQPPPAPAQLPQNVAVPAPQQAPAEAAPVAPPAPPPAGGAPQA